MEPFISVTGRVAPLDMADVDTDQIIPKQFLKRIERTGFGEFLFHDWRKESFYVLDRDEYKGAPILVAGRNFGCGSSREHAPWALEDFGFRAIIASSFADIFRNNCTKVGILPVELPEEQVRQIMDRAINAPEGEVSVDLKALIITGSDGEVYSFEIDEPVRQRLLNGWDDIGLTLEHEGSISAYEDSGERDGPFTSMFA